MIVTVLPDLTGLDKQFDYLVPDEFAARVAIGAQVRVPLGPRRVRGWVTAIADDAVDGDAVDDGALDASKLKPIAAVVGLGPSADVIALGEWAAWRWAGRLRPFLAAASPPRVVNRLSGGERRSAHGGPLEAPRGGVVRVAPASDVMDVVTAAAERGPTLVVCPAVEGAALLGARLRGTGLSVAVVPGDWARASSGTDVVIGARTAVWAPCPDMASIVVVDEHDEALQDERSPTWHARDVAIERARRAGIPCWLVSPCPTLEALAWAGDDVARPSRNDERAGWPIVEVVDRSRDEVTGWSWLTPRLLQLAQDPRQRLVCVTNIRGRARRLRCRACRAQTVCEACGAGVAQSRGGELTCARCGTQRPAVCQACGSTRLAGIGTGAARLRDELAAAVRRPVVEVSGDTAQADLIDADAVLVGTEAVLHRAHDATVVAFVDFDSELLAPRFGAAEEAMVLVVRAARLVGGRAGGGRILLQTHLPRHDVVQAAVHADPQRLVDEEWARRIALQLPPAVALAEVSGTAAGEWLAEIGLGLEVSGPADGHWLVRAPSWDELADGLAAMGSRPKGVRVEVDPHRI